MELEEFVIKKIKNKKNSLHNQIKIELKKFYIDFNFLKKLGHFSDSFALGVACLSGLIHSFRPLKFT